MSRPNYIRQIITNHGRRLQKLREKEALQGFDVDPKVPLEIAEIEARIQQLETELEEEEERTIFRRFWQIDENESLLSVISQLRPRLTPQYWRPMTGFGEIQGLYSICYSLKRAYQNIPIRDDQLFFGPQFPPSAWRSSVIILGGDDNNQVMQAMKEQFLKGRSYELPIDFEYQEFNNDQILEAMKEQFLGDKCYEPSTYFRYQKRKKCTGLICRDPEGEKRYKPIINERKEIEIDYGMVARFPNPYNFDSKLFIFAGCHTYGTAAAARIVASKPILQQIEGTCPTYRTTEFFAAAVRCSVNQIDRHFFNVDRMEVFYPLKLDEDDKLQSLNGIKRNVEFPTN